jgi:hypothetical protein
VVGAGKANAKQQCIIGRQKRLVGRPDRGPRGGFWAFPTALLNENPPTSAKGGVPGTLAPAGHSGNAG